MSSQVSTLAPHRSRSRPVGSGNGGQGGYLLLELLLVLVIIGATIPFFLRYKARQDDDSKARALGIEMSQYVSGLRAFLSDQGTSALSSVGCTAGALCTKSGTNWLKNRTNCTTATGALTKSYIPCSFEDVFQRYTVTTYLFQRGTEEHAVVELGAITDHDGYVRPDLTSLAALTADGELAGLGLTTVAGGAPSVQPVAGAFYSFYTYTGGAWSYSTSVEAPTPPVNGLVGEANTAPSLDAWLRTDGSNQMNADLNMGGHNIVNVNNVVSSGIVQAKDFVDTNLNGGTALSSVWSGSAAITYSGQSIVKPVCAASNAANTAVPDGAFIPSALVYYPNNDAGTPGALAGTITGYSFVLQSVSATQWVFNVYVTSPDAPFPGLPYLLNSRNSIVRGSVFSRCSLS